MEFTVRVCDDAMLDLEAFQQTIEDVVSGALRATDPETEWCVAVRFTGARQLCVRLISVG